jgi:ribonuclease D
VDTLAGLDLASLLAALAGKSLIMHACDFDLRLLWEFGRFRASEVFDTMIAAQLLGKEGLGLAALLDACFGLHHPKGSQKKDWSLRPLTPQMIEYAAGDIAHLFELRRVLLEDLRELNREEWHRQKCLWQIEASTSGFPPNDDAWRTGSQRGWPPGALAALYEIWHWREAEAERRDRPPFMVLGAHHVSQIALASANGKAEAALASLPPALRQRYAGALLAALDRAGALDPATLPRRKHHKRPPQLSARAEARQNAIQKHRDQVAQELKIDPTLIASRAHLIHLALRPHEAGQILLPWQQDLLRPALQVGEREEVGESLGESE